MFNLSNAKRAAYVSLILWVVLIFFLYFNLNEANVNFSIGVYIALLSHMYTLVLLLIPCLILISTAVTIYTIKKLIFKRA